MKRNTGLLILMLIVLTAVLAGCGSDATKPAATEAPAVTEVPAATEAPVQAAEGLIIPIDTLTEGAQFIDWTQDGVAMQIIALKDSEGVPQLAYNTCQVCAGSPYAYFEYENGMLVCQN